VALVLDASSSMTGPKLKAAKAAAGSFLDALRLGRDRAAVVAFDQEAHVLAGLTADRGVARSAVDRVTAAEGTRIDRGLRAATDLLRTGRRPDGRPVIVLLTDGRPELGTEAEAINAAAAARADGVHVVAIGLGADVDAASLARMTAAPGDVHLAPTPADLDAIYLNLAANLPCG
jgi:Ca-activated chloride channel family protein